MYVEHLVGSQCAFCQYKFSFRWWAKLHASRLGFGHVPLLTGLVNAMHLANLNSGGNADFWYPWVEHIEAMSSLNLNWFTMFPSIFQHFSLFFLPCLMHILATNFRPVVAFWLDLWPSISASVRYLGEHLGWFLGGFGWFVPQIRCHPGIRML